MPQNLSNVLPFLKHKNNIALHFRDAGMNAKRMNRHPLDRYRGDHKTTLALYFETFPGCSLFFSNMSYRDG